MIAAEKWYEYQENYQKYGLDMKPKQPRRKPKVKKTGINAKDKARLLGFILVAGVICIGLIISTAFAATIQYENNGIQAANRELEVEIEGLTREVESASNIKTIEQKARGKLGMVSPKKSQLIYLPGKGKAKTNSAKVSKEKV